MVCIPKVQIKLVLHPSFNNEILLNLTWAATQEPLEHLLMGAPLAASPHLGMNGISFHILYVIQEIWTFMQLKWLHPLFADIQDISFLPSRESVSIILP